MIDEGLFSFLSDHAPLTALIGSNIFPGMVPIGKYPPAVTYQNVTSERQERYCGVSNTVSANFIINSFHASSLESKRIAEVIRRALKNYSGPMGEEEVVAVYLATELKDLVDPEPGYFYTSQTFVIWHVET